MCLNDWGSYSASAEFIVDRCSRKPGAASEGSCTHDKLKTHNTEGGKRGGTDWKKTSRKALTNSQSCDNYFIEPAVQTLPASERLYIL